MKRFFTVLSMVCMVVGFVIAEEPFDESLLYGEKGKNWYSPDGDTLYVWTFFPSNDERINPFMIQSKRPSGDVIITGEFIMKNNYTMLVHYITARYYIGGKTLTEKMDEFRVCEFSYHEGENPYFISGELKFVTEEYMKEFLGVKD